MNTRQQFGAPFYLTATGASLASVVVSSASNVVIYVTDVAASSDLSGALFEVVGGNVGTLWQLRLNTGTAQSVAGFYDHVFMVPVFGTVSQTVTVQVRGSAASFINVAGYKI